jgi:hypothetical protein
MKRLFFASAFIFLGVSANAQNKFIGTWSKEKGDPICDYIKIGKDSSVFSVVCNQLGLDCRNVYKQDTLYLYVTDSDYGRAFMGPKYEAPKTNSLFAKCYIVNSDLKIVYTQKMFSNNIKDLGLNTTLHKN